MGLQLPAVFYGRYRDVKPRLAKIVRKVVRGADWTTLCTQDGMLDVDKTPGYLVLKGPSSLIGGEEHFQCWLLWSLLRKPPWLLSDEQQEAVFRQSLTTCWGTLGLVGYDGIFWLDPPERQVAFLRAVLTCWDELASVGARFTSGMRHGFLPWTPLSTSIQHTLVRLGAPAEPLRQPLPPGGLPALIQMLGVDLTVEPTVH